MPFIEVGSSRIIHEISVKGNSKDISMRIGDTALKTLNETAVQSVIKATGGTVSKVIGAGGDILAAPAVWLQDMQKNWLQYMVLAAVILSCIVFLYCTVCSYFQRTKNNSSANNLVELVKVISGKNGILQHPLPLSPLNLPSVPPNTPALL